jgi:hypothetical protein
MEYNAPPLSEEDLAEMQQASAAFEPEVTVRLSPNSYRSLPFASRRSYS